VSYSPSVISQVVHSILPAAYFESCILFAPSVLSSQRYIPSRAFPPRSNFAPSVLSSACHISSRAFSPRSNFAPSVLILRRLFSRRVLSSGVPFSPRVLFSRRLFSPRVFIFRLGSFCLCLSVVFISVSHGVYFGPDFSRRPSRSPLSFYFSKMLLFWSRVDSYTRAPSLFFPRVSSPRPFLHVLALFPSRLFLILSPTIVFFLSTIRQFFRTIDVISYSQRIRSLST